ncbi:MAG: threonylcarbamoyl-AMP synthase [Legionella sp.]|nr:threonylcarbamoyl-AMP synthase [Legionella sp.]
MSTITNDFELALSQLSSGKVVAIPTETVYGLAGDATNPLTVQKIYSMKQRPADHPLIVHVHKDFDLMSLVSYIPEYAKKLISAFWPGSLTLVLPVIPGKVNAFVTGGQQTVAIRCPDHPLAQRLLRLLNTPLVAPSANPFKKISPTTAQHVQASFPNEELVILDGGRCTIGIESTIVLATDTTHYQILRQGGIDKESLQQISSGYLQFAEKNVRVPGQLAQHYQPTKPLYYFNSTEALKTFINKHTHLSLYLMCFQRLASNYSIAFDHQYQFPTNQKQVSFELYYQLRKADESSADCILIEMPSAQLGWESISERIHKAGRPLESYGEKAVDFVR